MASISTISVNDAAATPVAHVFNPSKIDGNSAYYLEQSGASALEAWPMVMTHTPPLAGQTGRIYRDTVKLAIPIVVTETINGVSSPKVIGTMRFTGEFVIPEVATLQNRKDLRKLSVGLLDSAAFKSNVEDLLNTY